jgi:hypothetical protein
MVNEDNPGQVLLNQVVVSDGIMDNVNVVNEDNPGQVLRNQVVVVSNVNTMYVDNVNVNDVNEDRNVNNLEQALLSLEEENLDHGEVDVNDRNGNENVNNSEQVLLVNVNHVDVDVNAEAMECMSYDEPVNRSCYQPARWGKTMKGGAAARCTPRERASSCGSKR